MLTRNMLALARYIVFSKENGVDLRRAARFLINIMSSFDHPFTLRRELLFLCFLQADPMVTSWDMRFRGVPKTLLAVTQTFQKIHFRKRWGGRSSVFCLEQGYSFPFVVVIGMTL